MAAGGEDFSEIKFNFLSCSLCLEEYKKPRTLDCLHTFCEICLQNYAAKNNVSPTQRLVCPLCRTKTVIPQGGVKELKSNFILNELSEYLSLKDSGKKVHVKLGSHDDANSLCKTHGKPCEIFCLRAECKTALCIKCLSSHYGHPMACMEEIAKEKKSSLMETKTILDSMAADIEENLKITDKNMKEIQHTEETLCQEVKTRLQEIVTQVSSRADLIISEITAEMLGDKKKVERKHESLKQKQKSVKHLADLVNYVLMSDASHLVISGEKVITANMDQILSTFGKTQDCNYVSCKKLCYNVNPIYKKELEQMMGKLSAGEEDTSSSSSNQKRSGSKDNLGTPQDPAPKKDLAHITATERYRSIFSNDVPAIELISLHTMDSTVDTSLKHFVKGNVAELNDAEDGKSVFSDGGANAYEDKMPSPMKLSDSPLKIDVVDITDTEDDRSVFSDEGASGYEDEMSSVEGNPIIFSTDGETCRISKFRIGRSGDRKEAVVSGFCFGPNKTIAVCDSRNKRVKIFDFKGNLKNEKNFIFQHTPQNIVFHPDFNEFLVAVMGKGIRRVKMSGYVVWDKPVLPDLKSAYDVSVLPNGDILTLGAGCKVPADVEIAIWTKEGRMKTSWYTPKEAICIKGNDKIVVSCGNQFVQAYTLRGNKIWSLRHSGHPHVCFDSKGNILISDYYENSTRMFDAQGNSKGLFPVGDFNIIASDQSRSTLALWNKEARIMEIWKYQAPSSRKSEQINKYMFT